MHPQVEHEENEENTAASSEGFLLAGVFVNSVMSISY